MNKFKVYESLIQGSEQWFQIRKGRATASQASKILTSTGKLSKSRFPFMWHLASECLADDPLEWTGNKFTDWGEENEPAARELFSEITGKKVEEVGFCVRQDNVIGCSPDGLLIDDKNHFKGGLELKCPSRNKHADYHREGILPTEYKLQVHWSLALTELPFWYFMSYFPGLRPFILKVEADSFTESVRKAQDDFLIDYAKEYPKALKALEMPTGEEEAA